MYLYNAKLFDTSMCAKIQYWSGVLNVVEALKCLIPVNDQVIDLHIVNDFITLSLY